MSDLSQEKNLKVGSQLDCTGASKKEQIFAFLSEKKI